MKKTRVLFICIHNSARSQMAEGFLNKNYGERFKAESAGLEKGNLNPIVVEAMKEVGIDISTNKTKTVESMLDLNKEFEYVIAVCSKEAAQRCPAFPGIIDVLHWPFDDPSSLLGSNEEKLSKTRIIRDSIKKKIDSWVKTLT